jgi:hypothetical protein
MVHCSIMPASGYAAPGECRSQRDGSFVGARMEAFCDAAPPKQKEE